MEIIVYTIGALTITALVIFGIAKAYFAISKYYDTMHRKKYLEKYSLRDITEKAGKEFFAKEFPQVFNEMVIVAMDGNSTYRWQIKNEGLDEEISGILRKKGFSVFISKNDELVIDW